MTNYIEVPTDEQNAVTVEEFLNEHADELADPSELIFSKSISYVGAAVQEEVKAATGYDESKSKMHGCRVIDVLTLETRTLRERMQRHSAVREALNGDVDSDSSDDGHENY